MPINTAKPSENHYDPEKIFAQNHHTDGPSNSSSGLPHTNGNAGGMVGGNMDKDSGMGFFSEGLAFGIEALDSIISYGSAFGNSIFEQFFDGSLSIFGLTKSETFAIKSLGVLTALNFLSLKSQLKLNLMQNTSLTSKGMGDGL